jgi:hypothetical protein
MSTSASAALEALEPRRLLAGIPAMSIHDLTLTEGSAGTRNAEVVVSLSHPRPKQTVTVKFATQDGSAAAGSDYTTTSGTLTFPPGVDGRTIVVPVRGDATAEADEYFRLNLQNARQSKIADGQAVITIVDDDPNVSINDVSGDEGHSGTSPFNFTVNLSSPAEEAVTVNYSTANGSAVAGVDYQATSGTLTFAPGDTSKMIAVAVTGDRVGGSDRSFFVNLHGGSANISGSQGTGTIRDDEPRISITGVYAYEGNSGDTTPYVFTVNLSRKYDQPVTVAFATQDYDAVSGTDYGANSDVLTFAPGDTQKTITVQVYGNTTPQPDKNFVINLSNASGNALVTTGQGWGTIGDDDGYYYDPGYYDPGYYDPYGWYYYDPYGYYW